VSSLDLSVALATSNRHDLLAVTLQSFAAIAPPSLRWEMVVVDDGDEPETEEVLRRFTQLLPLVHLKTSGREGKNAALNLAAERMSGSLVALVDDDIVPAPDWFSTLMQGVARWPDHEVFGGKISARMPAAVPSHIDLAFPLLRWALAITDDIEEGPTLPERIWGPTMAIRRSVLASHRFDPDRGPQVTEYVTGGEVEFVRRVSDARGVPPIHLPDWSVEHVIRPDQLSEDWLLGRVFRMGRENALRLGRGDAACVAGVPAHLYRDAATNYLYAFINRKRPEETLKNRLWAAWARGAIYQFRRMP
jgi:glycosyltransferase involved in cell wall biosynthesis